MKITVGAILFIAAAFTASAQQTTAPAESRQGMVVAKDPEGGLRAPTAAEAAALAPPTPSLLRSVAASPQSVPAVSGTMVVLDPADSNVYSVMTKGPDGKLRMECITGEKAAGDLVHRVPATPAKPVQVGAPSEK